MLNFDVNTNGFNLNDVVEFKLNPSNKDVKIGTIKRFYCTVNHFISTYDANNKSFKKGDIVTRITVYAEIYDDKNIRYFKTIDNIIKKYDK